MFRRIVLVAALALATFAIDAAEPAEVEAKCAMSYLQPYVATPDDTLLPIEGGAILIGLRGRGDAKDDMDALPESFTIVKGKERIELELELLAPGFARAVPKEAPSAGTWAVEGVLARDYNAEGGYDPATVTFGKTALPSPPDAPAIASATLSSERRARRLTRVVHAALDGQPPGEAAFLVSSWADAPDASKGGAFLVNVEDEGLVVFRSRGRCTSAPTGEAPPSGNSSAVVRWVDAYGQVSAASKPFEVTASAEPDGPPEKW